MGISRKPVRLDLKKYLAPGRLSPALWLWGLAAAVILLLSVSHVYNDILITVKQSIHFWDLLGEGRPLDFYKDSIMYSGNRWYSYAEQGAGYPFLVYLTFAVWNLPLWFAEKALGDDLLNSLPCLIWVKLMLVVAICLSARVLYRIAGRFAADEAARQRIVFAFSTSLLLLSSTCIASQYDIITVTLMLYGLDAWLAEKRGRFVLFFGLAVSFKYFAFLPLVPLLLLWEKNLLKILRDLVLAWLPSLALQLPFSIGDSTRGVVMGSSKRLMVLFTTPDWTVGSLELGAFLLVVALACLFCYFSPRRPNPALLQHMTFAELAAMGAFSVLVNIYPYWAVLSVPFFVLAAVCAPRAHQGKVLLCEMALEATLFILQLKNYDWVFGSRTMLSMIWPRLLGVTGIDFESVGFALFQKIGLTDSIYFSTVAMCAWLAMLVLCWPRRQTPAADTQADAWYDPPVTLVYYGRLAVNVCLAFVPTIVFFLSVIEYYGGAR